MRPPAAQTSFKLPGDRKCNIIMDIRRRWDPCVAQTGLILPGGRKYNGFLSGDDNNRYKEEEGPPCVTQIGLILPGDRKYN